VYLWDFFLTAAECSVVVIYSVVVEDKMEADEAVVLLGEVKKFVDAALSLLTIKGSSRSS